MKKLLTVVIALITMVSVNAQEKTQETVKTKMDVFLSKTGTIIKYVDYPADAIKASYSVPTTRIRKISNGVASSYFYQISKEGKYSTSTASIEYTDLVEIVKAIKTLKAESTTDVTSPNYLENKFISTDGFQLGYYVSTGKLAWYIKLEKYGSDNTLFIDDVSQIENAFTNAKTKIEELKK
jgi:hypothetical protein